VWEVKVLTSGVNIFHQEGLRSEGLNSRPRRLTPGMNRTRSQGVSQIPGIQRAGYPRRWALTNLGEYDG
jgi:hypothetical protein